MLDNEFGCPKKDLESLDHILNESKSLGRQAMIPDFIEISKHVALHGILNLYEILGFLDIRNFVREDIF